MQPDVERRLIVVDDADNVKAIGKSGKSFSTDLLQGLARGRSVSIVEFEGLRAEQNLLSKRVGSATPAERPNLLESAKDLANAVKRADAERRYQ